MTSCVLQDFSSVPVDVCDRRHVAFWVFLSALVARSLGGPFLVCAAAHSGEFRSDEEKSNR